MEWRGGMVPHFELSKSESNDGLFRDYYRPPLREITQNWSQYRGPAKNGHAPTSTVAIDWKRPPRARWFMPCGEGHSSIITSGKLVITLEQEGNQEVLIARNLDDGLPIWKVSETTKWQDSMSGIGPRSTPTLHQGKIYTLFSNGRLSCLDAKSGEVFWNTQILKQDYNFPEWGLSMSPLVWNDRIILNPGGEESAVHAYAKDSGDLKWTSRLKGQGVYMSPEILSLLGEDHLLVALEGKIAGLDPNNGETLWETPWKIFLNNAQIVQPIAISKNSFLLAAGYGKGAECLSIARDSAADKYLIDSVWESKNLKAKFSNPVLKDGYLYGFSENLLVCLETKSGKLMWRGKKYGYGRILLVGQKLLILGNTGELSVIAANPNEFLEISSNQLLNDARCWNGPALVNGYLIARNGEQIACFDWAKQ